MNVYMQARGGGRGDSPGARNVVYPENFAVSVVYEGCSKNKVTLWFSQKILIYSSIFMLSPSK